VKTTWKVIVVVALVAAIAGVVVLKQHDDSTGAPPMEDTAPTTDSAGAPKEALPRLVELGADKCVPCKMMAPILEELRQEYAGRLQVDFFDVWKNPDIAKEYGIQSIPTQIFYDATGRELFRNPGYISKEDILAKWKELGVELASGQ